jgi:hypothetical protein
LKKGIDSISNPKNSACAFISDNQNSGEERRTRKKKKKETIN